MRRKVPLPPHSDGYNAFLAWVVNKVCMVLATIAYVLAASLITMWRSYDSVMGAPDALLLLSDLSSCKVPGVLPGLADPCPAAPLAASEL